MNTFHIYTSGFIAKKKKKIRIHLMKRINKDNKYKIKYKYKIYRQLCHEYLKNKK